MEKVYNEIIGKIAALYDRYENEANQKSEEKRKKLGAQIDKKEKQFLNDLIRIQQNIQTLIKDIEKSPNVKNANVASAYRNVNNTLKDIQSITKKKSLMFKVNEHLSNLAQSTNQEINLIRKLLPGAADSGFCCGGGDGQKKFKQVVKRFQTISFQWRMLAQLQPKDSIENFISPKFDHNEYSFLNKILRDNWPKPSEPKVIEKVKEIQKVKQVHVGGQTRCSLANEYLFGVNRQQNPSYGLTIYHEQAEKKDSAACSFLGQVYEQGVLLPQNLAKAMKYYQNSTKPYAKYRFAMSLIRGKLNQSGITRADIEKGHKLLLQLGEKGDQMCPEALVELGQLYEKGSFDCDQEKVYRVNTDLKQAINYYKKARALHLPRASNNLGVLYFNNKYISEADPNSKITNQSNAQDNLEKAKKYLEQSQEQGFCRSFYNLGCIYEKGLIGKKDPEKALRYFYEGGLKGDIQSKLKFAYQLMKQTSIMKQEYEDHYKIAHKWLEGIILKREFLQDVEMQSKKLTQLQKAEAMFYLGLMYEFGFGVEKSPRRAFNFFLQSSDLDYPAAKNKIGDCYFSGYGVREDREMAIGCYLEAADLNSADAMVNLGTIYLNGIPGLVERNYTKAYDNFIKAMDLDNSDAMIHLSYMYRNGLGFDSEPQMAKKLLEEAAKNKNSTALYMLKQIGGQFDERVLFDNLDNEFFSAPKKINLKEIIPVIPNAKSVAK